MGKPEDMTDEEWEHELDARALERDREQRRDRIAREGFETNAYEPEPSELCQFRLMRKVRNRWTHEPCGDRAIILLEFAGPAHPEGMKMPLCRSCLAKHVKDLIGYLE